MSSESPWFPGHLTENALENRRSEADAKEFTQGEATKDVTPETVCRQVGAESSSTQSGKSQENNEEGSCQAWPLEQDIQVRPPLRRF